MDEFVRGILGEDLGERGDVTSQATIPAERRAAAYVVAREGGRVSGLIPAARAFELSSSETTFAPLVSDGAFVERGERLARVEGPARALLAAERVALNLLGHLSGVASATAVLVGAIDGTGASIIDTRKTTPGLRAFEKQAVVHGGGANHRMGLYDAVLIKDNHLAVVGSVEEAVRAARQHVGTSMEVTVEVERVADVEAAVAGGADVVLLDNMSPPRMREAVSLAAGRCLLEASGGITVETVREVAESGVDRISVGWVTHSAPSLDVALDFTVPEAETPPSA